MSSLPQPQPASYLLTASRLHAGHHQVEAIPIRFASVQKCCVLMCSFIVQYADVVIVQGKHGVRAGLSCARLSSLSSLPHPQCPFLDSAARVSYTRLHNRLPSFACCRTFAHMAPVELGVHCVLSILSVTQ